jgi:hypothetical protein
MSLYGVDRTFYEVTVVIYTDEEVDVYNGTCAPPSGFTSGILEISLFGALDKLVYLLIIDHILLPTLIMQQLLTSLESLLPVCH